MDLAGLIETVHHDVMFPPTAPRPGVLMGFYGDDFTGSTDALEAVATAGLPALLFLAPPTPEDLARHPDLAVVGIAGTSRSRAPDWMDTHLPAAFSALQRLGVRVCHYKTCSTFDSAPQVGSIGRAAEIGRAVFGDAALISVGVPRHQRFVVFSNLFAAGSFSGAEEIFRIDRHPTMSRHPVTPMDEADLRRHLARQTGQRILGFDFRRMLRPDAAAALEAEIAAGAELVVLDGFDEATLAAAGALIAGRSERAPTFVVGSSGVEYALLPTLAAQAADRLRPPPQPAGPARRIVVCCGSCSPVTEGQIAWAEAHGFAMIAADTPAIITRRDDPALSAALADSVVAALGEHRGVVLHSARGGADPRIAPTRAALAAAGLAASDSAGVLGAVMGRTMREVVARTGLERLILAGGDSSSHTVAAMGVTALEMAAPLLPGAPLCRVHSADAALQGLELALKGGQVGGPDCFGVALGGMP